MPKMIDLTGCVFGKWTVIAASGKNKAGKMFWHCQCECGMEKRINGRHLRDGTSTQCRGCAHRTHGATNGRSPTGEYIVWSGMISRCHNSRNKAYQNYGGRGIIVCDRWRGSFEAFLSDMGPRPKGMTLDRENNSKGYSAENCRWATYTQQNRNRRDNRLITASRSLRVL